MKANINLLSVLGTFFALLAVTYTAWSALVYGRLEWVGTTSLGLVSIFALLIGFYLARSYQAQGGQLPEDRPDASIDDGDPEVGFFSPFSWWPLILATSGALAFLGLAVGYWILFIAAGVFVIAIVGWVYEYYRGNFAH